MSNKSKIASIRKMLNDALAEEAAEEEKEKYAKVAASQYLAKSRFYRVNFSVSRLVLSTSKESAINAAIGYIETYEDEDFSKHFDSYSATELPTPEVSLTNIYGLIRDGSDGGHAIAHYEGNTPSLLKDKRKAEKLLAKTNKK